MNPAKNSFSLLVELAKDTGLIGSVLRNYPAWLFRAADKSADQDVDYQDKHNDPNRLPLPNPWLFLLDAPAISKEDKTVFRAAQSQLPALSHLIHIATGIATLNTDWYREFVEAQASGNKRKYNRAVRKIAEGHIVYAHVQEDVRKRNDPRLLKQMELLWRKRRTQFVHRGKGHEVKQPKPLPSWKEFRRQNGLPVALVEWWVRCGVDGVPGLMFWRNEALAKFLPVHLDQSNLDSRVVKKIRQQLGLIPVGDKNHFVWDVSIKIKNNGERETTGYSRNGEQCFCGIISPKKKISAAVMATFSSF